MRQWNLVRDLNQLAFIFDVMPQAELCNLVEKFRLVLNDPVMPQDAVRSTGRETQSELYTAAICWNAELLPVTIEEPDVQCSCDGTTFGLAVKRLKKNVDRLQDRIKEAAEQIERAAQPGVAVIDSSLVLNPDNERMWSQIDDAEFGMLTRKRSRDS